MPFYTKLEDDEGNTHFVLFQRELPKGTVVHTKFTVRATKFLATMGRDYALRGPTQPSNTPESFGR